MSKHWDPRVVRGGKTARPRRHRPASRFTPAELRLAGLGGMLAGLLAVGISALWPAAPAAEDWRNVPFDDPWEESRRSGDILKDQGGSAAPAGVEIVAAGAVIVIDGDTFDYGGERIRIADIDTPEVKGHCPYETALAAKATERMAALLGQGPFELTPVERDEDRFGRKLRIVTRGGHSLGDQLVAEGLARTWAGRREPWCA